MRRVRDRLQVRVPALLRRARRRPCRRRLVRTVGRVGGRRLEHRGRLAAGQGNAERERGRGERDRSEDEPAATRAASRDAARRRRDRASGLRARHRPRPPARRRAARRASPRPSSGAARRPSGSAAVAVGAVARAGSARAISSIIVPPRRSWTRARGRSRRSVRCAGGGARGAGARPRCRDGSRARRPLRRASAPPRRRAGRARGRGRAAWRARGRGRCAGRRPRRGRARRSAACAAARSVSASRRSPRAAVVGEHLAGHAVEPRQRLRAASS